MLWSNYEPEKRAANKILHLYPIPYASNEHMVTVTALVPILAFNKF